jgi:maltose/moltooligosaccharide transporter
MNVKPDASFWRLWNMSFGFLGIQFGWGLQMANMSPIYEYLGAQPEQIPGLWLAAPLTGLLVQPIIGYFSDRTWHPKWGRRRPYFLVGAILSSLALIAMPNSSALWMAAGLLWILDASINVSMEPFRAFVADLLPPEQRVRGFAMQAFFIGIGAVAASWLPWILTNVFGLTSTPGGIPRSVMLSFYIGSAVFLGAVVWTVVTTPEAPPSAPAAEAAPARGLIAEVVTALREMPKVMRQLAPVQLFTWLGLFCMWVFFSVAVANNIFGGKPGTPEYREGTEFAGLVLGLYSLVCFLFSPFLPALAQKLGRPRTHALCLSSGALSLIAVGFINNKWMLIPVMLGVGIAWASTLAMPYAILTPALPAEKMGLYVGIFNFFIVLPEIFQALTFGPLMEHVLMGNRVAAVVIGGVSMGIAALLALRVESD